MKAIKYRYELCRNGYYEVEYYCDDTENTWTQDQAFWEKYKDENGIYVNDTNSIVWYVNESDEEPFIHAVRKLWEMAVFEASSAENLVKFAETLQTQTRSAFGDSAEAILSEALPRKEVEKAISDLTKSLHDRWLAANDVKNDFYNSRYLK